MLDRQLGMEVQRRAKAGENQPLVIGYKQQVKSWLATVGSGGHRRTRIVTVLLCIKLKTRRQEEEGRLWLSVSIRFFTPVSLTMHRLISDEIGAKQEASCFCSYHLIAFVCLLYQDGGVTKKNGRHRQTRPGFPMRDIRSKRESVIKTSWSSFAALPPSISWKVCYKESLLQGYSCLLKLKLTLPPFPLL